MKQISILSFISVILFSCNADSSETTNTKNTNTQVSGTISNGVGSKLYFDALNAASANVLDSITLDDKGNFSFGANVENQGFYRIKISDENSIVLILEKGDKVSINASANNLQTTYIVDGSKETQRLQKLNSKEYQLYVKNDSLKRELMKYQQLRDGNGYLQTQNSHTALLTDRMNFLKSFIDEKPGSLASLAAVERLDKEQDFDYYKKVAESLKTIMPESEYYKNLEARVDQWGRLAIGGEAPEIILNNPQGETIALSTLRGRIVLIDFWASWCKPCRAENPNVVKMYNKYKNKGFDIYSVSLDKNHTAWTKAIESDGLVWSNHVSDLKFWQSAAVKLYDVKGIPLTYLIDKDGKIIAKNLRGSALEAKLKELFGA